MQGWLQGALRSTRTLARPVIAAGVLAIAGCGATPSPSVPSAESAPRVSAESKSLQSSARELTLISARGSVQATVRPDDALAGQYVVAFAPGLRDGIPAASTAVAAVIAAATGTTPAPTIDFYSVDPDRFYIGEGAERYCVQVIRENEGSGIVALRFARSSSEATAVRTPAPKSLNFAKANAAPH